MPTEPVSPSSVSIVDSSFPPTVLLGHSSRPEASAATSAPTLVYYTSYHHHLLHVLKMSIFSIFEILCGFVNLYFIYQLLLVLFKRNARAENKKNGEGTVSNETELERREIIDDDGKIEEDKEDAPIIIPTEEKSPAEDGRIEEDEKVEPTILTEEKSSEEDLKIGEDTKNVPTNHSDLSLEVSTQQNQTNEPPSPPATDSLTEEYSNISNYEKLHYAYWETIPSFFRCVFRKVWQLSEGKAWEDNEESGRELILKHHKIMKLGKPQMKCLKSGNSSSWDLPLLGDLVLAIVMEPPNIAKMSPSLNIFDMKQITPNNMEKLKKIRNILAHAGNKSLSDESFSKLWEETNAIVQSMGMPETLLNKFPKSSSNFSEAAEKQAKKYKKSGNEFYKKRNLISAIDEYTKGIETPNISEELLSILYSNRSVARMELNDLKGAKSDAKTCLEIRPDWFRGYVRLATIYEKLAKFDKAIETFTIAKELGDNSKSTLDSLDFCIMKRTQLDRRELTDPDLLKQKDLTQQLTRKFLGKHGAVRFDTSTPNGLCAMGHRYEWGRDGCPQNYEIAANYFAQAAAMDDAEGLYNLAKLTQEGKGVKRDLKRGHRLLLQAASKPLAIEIVKGSGIYFGNVGVMSAFHSLGLAYDSGIVVDRDPHKALEWYHKSLSMGCGLSANNIAILLFAPFPEAIGRAFDYWKLSAHLGVVRAMENLANQYLYSLENKILAQDWFLYAIHKGSSDLKSRRSLFVSQPSLAKKFDPEKFAEKLEQEVRKSSVGYKLEEIETFLKKALDPAKFNEELDRKLRSQEPHSGSGRIDIIIRHRESLNTVLTKLAKDKHMKMVTTPPNLLPTSAAVDLVGLKEIFFKDMETTTTEDKIYEGHVLKVTVIEDAILGTPSIALIVQDGNGDIGRLFIYNHPQNGKETHAELGFGCRLSILYPHMRNMSDGYPGLRVDDPNLILKHTTLNNSNRCHYCGKAEGSKVTCRKCGRVSYCSIGCLKKDAVKLCHYLVCHKVIS